MRCLTRTPLTVITVGVVLALTACVSQSNPNGPTPSRTRAFVDVPVLAHGPQLRVGTDGGLHLAYGGFDGRPAVRYGTCSAGLDCTRRQNWTFATIADYGTVFLDSAHVKLALDANNRPRVLYSQSSLTGSVRDTVVLMRCDVNCTSAPSWTPSVPPNLTTGGGRIAPPSAETLSVTASGKAALIYTDPSDVFTKNPGVVLALFDGGAWQETLLLAGTSWRQLYLAYTPQDQARVTLLDRDKQPTYIECSNAPCTQGASLSLPVPAGNFMGISLVMRLDAQGRPRVAYFPGGDTRLLYYLWCDTACLASTNWNSYMMAMQGGNGRELDLALGTDGRPQIVYPSESGHAVLTAYCEANCYSNSALWKQGVIVDSADLISTPVNAGCTIARAEPGHNPVVALAPDGKPHFAYRTDIDESCSGRIEKRGGLARYAALQR